MTETVSFDITDFDYLNPLYTYEPDATSRYL